MQVLSLHHDVRRSASRVCTFALAAAVFALPARAQDAAPATVAADPSSAAGAQARERSGGFISQTIEFATRTLPGGGGEAKNGFYVETSNMVAGSGWISGGPGYRQWLWRDRGFLDASAAVSWRSFKMAQARFELPKLARSRVTAGAQVRWQDLTQLTYFGDGPDAPEANRSEYRLQSTDVVGYAAFRPVPWLTVGGHVGHLASPTIDEPGGTFRRDYPDARVLFGDHAVYQRARQPAYRYGGLSLVADTRDHGGYPSAGTLYRAAWSKFIDRDTDAFTFDRYEMEAAQFVPLAGRRVILALHGWIVGSDTSLTQTVPFYLEPSLGGSNTLRSYPSYRFHDRNLLLARGEARVPLASHVDAAVFVDAGSVAPRIGDLDLARRSYGAGLRVHTRRSTLARLDVAHGGEGWRLLLRLNDPFRLGRLSQHTAAAPFVP